MPIGMYTWLIYLSIASSVFAIDSQGFDDTILFKINWLGADGNSLLETNDAEPLVVRTENNEQYKCLLPQDQEKEKDSVETYNGPNPLKLLSSVFDPSTPCSHRLETYWTYELCHGRYIRQFHEERDGKKIKLQEYYLGKWDKAQYDKLYAELEEQAKDSNKFTVPTKKIDGVSMPYLEINMTDGTLCDLSPKPRVTKVLYVCYAHPKHEITSFKETSICEYEIIVLSPLLCKHPKYKPLESGENTINCIPFEGSPKKPSNLAALEAESYKLKNPKSFDEQLRQVYAVFSIDRVGEGQDGETRVRVEIHPVDVTVDDFGPDAPQLPESRPPLDDSPVAAFLSGKNCLTGGTGWWKYKFCYGASVDQYHIEKDGSKTVVQLGKFNKANHLEWLEKNPHKRPKPLAQRKQISQLYTGGSLCDKTGKPRQTEVKLKCLENGASLGSVALFLLEPNVCEYILGVESPFICDILSQVDENGLIELSDESTDEVNVSSEDGTVQIDD